MEVYCNGCGAEIDDLRSFCPKCGQDISEFKKDQTRLKDYQEDNMESESDFNLLENQNMQLDDRVKYLESKINHLEEKISKLEDENLQTKVEHENYINGQKSTKSRNSDLGRMSKSNIEGKGDVISRFKKWYKE